MRKMRIILTLFTILCAVNAKTQTLTISASLNSSGMPTLTPATICNGDSLYFIAQATAFTNNDTLNYQWYVIPAGGQQQQVLGTATLATTSVYSTDSSKNGDTVYCIATNMHGNTAASNKITVVVKPFVTPSVSIMPANTTTICQGATVSFKAKPANGGPTPAYQWYKDNGAVGTDSSAYTDSTLQNNDSVWCMLTSNAACTAVYTAKSNVAKFVVNPLVTPSVLITPTNTDTICQGTAVTFKAAQTNGGPKPAYQWYKNDSAVSGAATATYVDSKLNSNDSVWCVLTSNAACLGIDTAISNVAVFAVNPLVTASIVITPDNESPVCQGTNVTFTALPNNSGPVPGYQWYKDNKAIIGANAATYADASLNNNDSVWCLLTSDTACPAGNPAKSNVDTYTIYPVPAFTGQTAYTICSGTSDSVALTATTGNATLFTWSAAGSQKPVIDGYGNSGQPTTGTIAQTLTNESDSLQGNVAYTITPYTTNCVGQPAAVVVNVNPTPNFTDSVTLDTICSGTSTNLLLQASTGNGSTFIWSAVSSASPVIVGGGSAAQPSAGPINQTLTNNSDTLPGSVTYAVTPIAANCAGQPVQIVVTVNPTPQIVSFVNAYTICSGATTNMQLTASTGDSCYFIWSAASSQNPAIVWDSTTNQPSAGPISQTLINTSDTLQGSVTYTVTPVAANCTGPAKQVVVSINPSPQLTSPGAYAICGDSSTNINLAASTAGVDTFVWTIGPIVNGITGATSGTGNKIADNLFNPSNTLAGSVVYNVAITSGTGCAADTSITVTVNPTPQGPVFTLAPPHNGICQNTINQNFSVAPSESYDSISAWQVINPVSGIDSGRLVTDSTPGLLNAIISFYKGSVVVRTTETDARYPTNCAASTTYIVNVNNTPQDTSTVIFNGSDYVCLNNTVDGYQWGYDDPVTFIADTIANANLQNYYVGATTSSPNHLFWVITKVGACYTKNYDDTFKPVPDTTVAPTGGTLQISLSPNPAASTVTISWNTSNYTFAGKAMATVVDMYGKKLIVQQLGANGQAGQSMLDVSMLPAGVYIVAVWDGSKQKAASKLLKQ